MKNRKKKNRWLELFGQHPPFSIDIRLWFFPRCQDQSSQSSVPSPLNLRKFSRNLFPFFFFFFLREQQKRILSNFPLSLKNLSLALWKKKTLNNKRERSLCSLFHQTKKTKKKEQRRLIKIFPYLDFEIGFLIWGVGFLFFLFLSKNGAF